MAAKPILGQHWLVDPASLRAIVRLADLKAGETVLEIGTGKGHLTDYLLQTPASIVSLEYDRKLHQENLTKYERHSERLRLIRQDVRRFDWTTLPTPYKICANIPYYLSSYLLRCLTETGNKPELAVLLVAREVALKLAETQKRSLLAVLVQSHYAVELGPVVAKEAFRPPPAIDSQAVTLKRRPAFEGLAADQWPALSRLFRICFAANRKQLGVNLRNSGLFPDEELAAIWPQVKFSKERRAESLTDGEWQRLFDVVKKRL